MHLAQAETRFRTRTWSRKADVVVKVPPKVDTPDIIIMIIILFQ